MILNIPNAVQISMFLSVVEQAGTTISCNILQTEVHFNLKRMKNNMTSPVTYFRATQGTLMKTVACNTKLTTVQSEAEFSHKMEGFIS